VGWLQENSFREKPKLFSKPQKEVIKFLARITYQDGSELF
jgi:hypothetical protein